jgi:hypothetical protein
MRSRSRTSYHVAADDYTSTSSSRCSPNSPRLSRSPRASGLGVFTGTEAIIFMHVVRSAALDRLHQDIWDNCTPRFGVGLPYYSPEAWVPHVTLAQGPRTRAQLPEITRTLGERDLAWDIPVKTLAIIEDGGADRGLRHTVDLGGSRR